MSKLTRVITQIIIEKIEIRAELTGLERAFPYLDSSFYYARTIILTRRLEELEAILLKAEVGYEKDAPMEQFLVTRYVG